MSVRTGLRVVVTGATGNVGTSVVRALAEDPQVASVLGLARRVPELTVPRTEWAAVDLGQEGAGDQLVGYFAGADAVVHLAWRFQPTHDPVLTWQTNVLGSLRVFDAVVTAGVPALVHASSVVAVRARPEGGPGGRRVLADPRLAGRRVLPREVLPRTGAGHLRARAPARPRRAHASRVPVQGDVGERTAAHLRGPLPPRPPGTARTAPLGPRSGRARPAGTCAPTTAAQAHRQAVVREVDGAFNLAAGPVVDARVLGELLEARVVRVPVRVVRTALAAAWSAHLAPASPHLFDAVLRLPLLDASRAHRELGWQRRGRPPTRSGSSWTACAREAASGHRRWRAARRASHVAGAGTTTSTGDSCNKAPKGTLG